MRCRYRLVFLRGDEQAHVFIDQTTVHENMTWHIEKYKRMGYIFDRVENIYHYNDAMKHGFN